MQPANLSSIKIDVSPGLAGWLRQHRISLAFSSQQLGAVFLVGINPQDQTLVIERTPAMRATGLWCDQQRLLVASRRQLIRFENVLEQGEIEAGYDRKFISRTTHTTGDLRIHDINVLGDGRIVFVNTLYSCLATVSPTHSFKPLWAPPFISRLTPEDRCHLNGLAMRDGVPTHVTAVSQSDTLAGWRRTREKGGTLVDVQRNVIVSSNLAVPHSPVG